jgi:LmbE family N-acetylglucosaminyl deacetylase
VILSRSGQSSPIVLRRPHFHLTDDDPFFLISRNPHARLSRLEADVWNALEQGPSLEELRRRFSEKAADDVVRRFKDLGVCELAESPYPTGRRRVLVVEPHSDDAVLSIGGTLWARRHECEFVVATVGSRSNFTSYYMLGRDSFDVDVISSMRSAETELFVRLIGGQYRALGRSDAPLRYHSGNWSLDWFRRHNSSIGVFISRQASEEELSDCVAVIRELILNEKADQIWIPLGCYHTDHQLTRNACLVALLQNRSLLGHLPVRFYQEVPYDTRFPEIAASVVGTLERAGAEMTREVVPIASAFGDKLHLVSLYGSQFKLQTMRPEIEASARQAGGADRWRKSSGASIVCRMRWSPSPSIRTSGASAAPGSVCGPGPSATATPPASACCCGVPRAAGPTMPTPCSRPFPRHPLTCTPAPARPPRSRTTTARASACTRSARGQSTGCA